MNEKMEHTPGEWYVFDSGERANPIIEVRSSKEPVVFWSGFDRSEVPAKRRRANSRLISAGPRMYDFIAKRALEGDNDAAEIIASI